MSKAFSTTIYFIVLLAIISFGTWYVHGEYVSVAQPCREPLGYSVGEVDEEFGLGRAEVLRAVLGAEELWEGSVQDENIFIYDESAPLKINFQFDERQSDTVRARELQDEIADKNSRYSEAEASVQEQEKIYERDVLAYEAQEREYSQDLEAYNKNVRKINAAGGADEQERDELEEEREDLDKQRNALEEDRLKVNARGEKIQESVEDLNTFGGTINVAVEGFNTDFGEARVFDQGVFTGNEIVIYQYETPKSLILVLAHELGHARGLDHVSDPQAIMHEIFHEQDNGDPSIEAADKAELQRACHKKSLAEVYDMIEFGR